MAFDRVEAGEEISKFVTISKPNHPTPAVQYLYALFIALSLVSLISACTNLMPSAKWDAAYYLNMAKSGLIGNSTLVSPFAYRPGMPLVSRAVADVLSISVEDGFRTVGWISSICFLMAVFTLSRLFTTTYPQALFPMVILGLSVTHIKFPLFFYALVDVSAYPIMILSIWALMTKRLNWCLIFSGVGVLFKEFLAIPLCLVIIQIGILLWKNPTRRYVVHFVVALGISVAVVAIPRWCIPVSKTCQFVDPLYNRQTLARLLSAPMDAFRNFNILFNVFAYWLPTILLLTRQRFRQLRTDLQGNNLWILSMYLFLVLLLTMYGGTNLSVFVGYSVAAQAIVLALLFRNGVAIVEAIYVVCVMIAFNRIMFHIPLPQHSFDAYIDFYGGWSSRVTLPTLMRVAEMCMYVVFAAWIRTTISKRAGRMT